VRSPAIVALPMLFLATFAAAEQPDWDRHAHDLFTIRWHVLDGLSDDHGLWSFDPDNGSWERLRHFSFDADPHFGHAGHGCALTSADGVVVVQTWPWNLELEPGSYRILRRSSPAFDPAAAGWAVQGPAIGQADAARLGLSPGQYGFARCVGRCSPYYVPQTTLSVECTDDAPWPLLRRDDAGRLDLVGLLPPLVWDWRWSAYAGTLPTLSLDPGRRAFWRGTPRGLELIPVDDGGVGEPALTHLFDFPPFDIPETQLDVLYYHAGRDQLFLTSREHFVTLSTSLQPLATRTLEGGGWPLTLASLGQQPATHEQLLPVVAHTPGRNDTFWTSDLWLYNPSAAATTVTLRRVAAPAETRAVELPAHGSVRVPDALAFLGGGPAGDGASHDGVVLTAPYRWGEQVVATSRSFTAAPGGGTFGHAVTAAPGRAGYSNHLVYPGDPAAWEGGWNPYGLPSTLYADRRFPGQMRHNLGVVNDFDEPVTLTLLWGYMYFGEYYYPGSMALRPPGALQTVEVAAHSVRVIPLDTLFPPEVVDVWPPRIALWGSRPVALWFSMVDNLTGDATFVPSSSLHCGTDLLLSPLFDVRTAVPVVAHAPGEAGTFWRTDLYGADELVLGYFPAAWLHPSAPAEDCSGAAMSGEVVAVLPGEVAQPPEAWTDDWGFWRTVQRDVTRAFCPCSDDEDLHAGLEVLSSTWLVGWSRTYTTRDDGGTYGEMLPFYPEGGWPVQHFAGVEVGTAFRANVGLFNGDGEHAITHRITLYAADGQVAAERTITLQPYASLQRRLEHLFRMEVGSLPAGTYGMTVLPLDDPEHGVKGRSWAWVSLVDNVTNDPTNWW